MSNPVERFVHPDRLQYQQLTYEQMDLLKGKEDTYYLNAQDRGKFEGKSEIKGERTQYIWSTNDAITNDDVTYLFDHLVKKDQGVHINTGTHGDKEGKNVNDTQDPRYADTGFLTHDLMLVLKNKNVSIHIVAKDSNPTKPENANHVINAWCYSAVKTVREVIEEATQKHSEIPHGVQNTFHGPVGNAVSGNQSIHGGQTINMPGSK